MKTRFQPSVLGSLLLCLAFSSSTATIAHADTIYFSTCSPTCYSSDDDFGPLSGSAGIYGGCVDSNNNPTYALSLGLFYAGEIQNAYYGGYAFASAGSASISGTTYIQDYYTAAVAYVAEAAGCDGTYIGIQNDIDEPDLDAGGTSCSSTGPGTC
jgi:hypothetical protein